MRLLLKLFIQLLHSMQRIIVIYSSMYKISAIFHTTMVSNDWSSYSVSVILLGSMIIFVWIVRRF